jgi:hypothetical protein
MHLGGKMGGSLRLEKLDAKLPIQLFLQSGHDSDVSISVDASRLRMGGEVCGLRHLIISCHRLNCSAIKGLQG